MADISVTLGLDDSQYTGKLKQISAATSAESQKMSQGMNAISGSIQALNANIDKLNQHLQAVSKTTQQMTQGMSQLAAQLKNIVSVVAAGGFLKLAEDLTGLSNQIHNLGEATGMGTQGMLSLGLAGIAVGKDLQQTGMSMERLEANAEKAELGNLKLRDAFARVGISMGDLNKLSPEETFRKIVEQLALMTDSSERSYVATQLLGRGMATTDFEKYKNNLDETDKISREHATTIDRMSEAYNSISLQVMALKLNLMELIAPFVELIGDNSKGLIGSKTAAWALTAALTAITASAIISGLRALGLAFSALAIETAPITLSILAAGAATYVLATAIDYAFGTEILKNFEKGLDNITGKLKSVREDFDFDRGAGEGWDDTKKPPITSQRKLNPEEPKTIALQAELKAYNDALTAQRERIQLEIDFADKSEETRKSRLAGFDEDIANKRKIEALQTRINVLSSEQRNMVGVDHSGEIMALREEWFLLIDQKAQMGDLIKLRTEAQNKAALELSYINLESKAYLEKFKIQGQIFALQKTTSEQSLDSIYKQIQEEAKLIEKKRQAQLGTEKLPESEQIEILRQVTKAYQGVIAEQEKLNAASRDFDVAWGKSMKQFIDDATNGAKIADTLFKSMSSNIESYFLSLATKGKFSFNDLMQAILMDILKLEIKAATSSFFSMFSGLGSSANPANPAGGGMIGTLMSSIGSLFSGHAAGGSVGPGQFSLVGENGPELIRGPASVTPNQDIGSTIGSGVTHNYNINAVDAKSVAQLFYENRMTMFGMTEQARRELPMRTR